MEMVRTNSENLDFIELVGQLDTYLAIQDGEDHAFYNQFNSIDAIHHVVVLFDGEQAVACGAMKVYDKKAVEIKRMFTSPKFRGKGYATRVLKELEKWALELSFEKCILETGFKQPEAIELYKKLGYLRIPNYGQYKGVENSLCFEKVILG